MGLAEIAEPLDERVEIDPGPVHTRKDIFGKALDAYMKVPADLGMAIEDRKQGFRQVARIK